MMAAGEAAPSTPIELVSRLTEQLVTPGTFFTAFSTRAEQAAQLMPVTLYCSIADSFPLHKMPGRGSFHELGQQGQQLVQFFTAAIPQVVSHTGADVLAQQLL